MNTQTITIGTGKNAKKYKVRFDIKSNIILGKMWGVTKLSEIGNKLASLNFTEGEEPDMEQILVMTQLILSGIKSIQPKCTLDEQDIFDFISTEPEQSAKLMELYAESLPQNKAQKSKNVQPDQVK